jgi:hypothetical protein
MWTYYSVIALEDQLPIIYVGYANAECIKEEEGQPNMTQGSCFNKNASGVKRLIHENTKFVKIVKIFFSRNFVF